MTPTTSKIYSEAMNIPPIERAELIELLLASFERSDRAKLDQEWNKEATSRLKAFDDKQIGAKDSSTIFDEINKLHS